MILQQIVEKKKETLEAFHRAYSLGSLIGQAAAAEQRPSFKEALLRPGLSIIGEIKKASPSKGVIKEDFQPVLLAKTYEDAVDAISVLTEEYFFLGSGQYLQSIRDISPLPLLRKDFIIDELQIYESKLLGASCVLLITAILDKRQLERFIRLSRFLGLDALVEVHTGKELDTALECGADIIGINNRNLKDFSIDLNTTTQLRKQIPAHIPVISESGINRPDDIKSLKDAQVDGVLIGESFMRAADIKGLAEAYRRAYENTN